MPAPSKASKTRVFLGIIGGKALVIPEEGWNAANFSAHGEAMLLTLTRVARITQRRAARTVAKKALAIFMGQMRQVIERATRKVTGSRSAGPAGKTSIEIHLDQHAALWQEALDEVFRETGTEAVTELLPPVQSVMGQGYSKTSILLGQTPKDVGKLVVQNSRKLAARITGLSETTKRNIARVVRRSLDNGGTIMDTASAVEREAPNIFSNRALTIARTELNNAWTWGAAESLKQSESVTHVSIIGCEAREPGSPHYKGQSTCNYPDLSITEIDAFLETGFHVNHQGQLVPSRFRNADGTASALES